MQQRTHDDLRSDLGRAYNVADALDALLGSATAVTPREYAALKEARRVAGMLVASAQYGLRQLTAEAASA